MHSEWRIAKLVDVAAKKRWALNGGPFGSKLSRKHYSESGVPVIRGTNLSGASKFSFDDFVYVSEEKADELQANNAHPGDLIFTQRGTIGQVGLIPFDSPIARFVISQSQMKLTVDPEQADALFLYYFFSAAETVQEIQNLAFSAGVPHINLDILRKFETPVPPLPVQRRIAGILSAYDDLIDNSQRRIRILEAMARALYREWFVHFRFPGHEKLPRVASPLGDIPQGWEICALGDFVQFKSGFAFKSGTFTAHGEHRLVTIKNVQDGSFNPESDSRMDELPEKLPPHCVLEDGDILLSLTGNVGRVCLVYNGPFLLNQRVAKLAPAEDFDWAMIYCMFREPEMQMKLEQLSNGVAQQNLSPVLTSKMEFARPPRELRRRFAALAEPTVRLIVQGNSTIQNLRRTRDLLLPRLLSGAVTPVCPAA
jgi:type I restriction enzyme, S subunit